MSTLTLTNLHVADFLREGISRSISRWRATRGDVVASHGHPRLWVDGLARHVGQVEVHGSCTALQEVALLEVPVNDSTINITSTYQQTTKEGNKCSHVQLGIQWLLHLFILPSLPQVLHLLQSFGSVFIPDYLF